MLHCMNMATKFSAALVFKSTSLDEAVFGFEASWLDQFWIFNSIQGDQEFALGSFKEYMRIVP